MKSPREFRNPQREFRNSLKIPPLNLLLLNADETNNNTHTHVAYVSFGQWSRCATHPSHPHLHLPLPLHGLKEIISNVNTILNGHLNPRDELCRKRCSNTMLAKRCGSRCKLHLSIDDRRNSSGLKSPRTPFLGGLCPQSPRLVHLIYT